VFFSPCHPLFLFSLSLFLLSFFSFMDMDVAATDVKRLYTAL
jgi:hypothetical protein